MSYYAAEIVLTPADRAIRAMMAGRLGKANAITIAALARALSMRGYDLTARDIKQSVERLRRFGRMRIAASKGKGAGYFIVATAEEADRYASRMAREGVKLLKIAQLFSPHRDWVQELRGQLQL